MAGDHTNHEIPGSGATTLQAAVAEIRRLQVKMAEIDKEKTEKAAAGAAEDEIIEFQPLSQVLWDAKVPDNFKTLHLPSFDGKTDPLEHRMVVGTQTAIIGAAEHLKCKLLSGTLKDTALRWYMNLPNNSIGSFKDFSRKFIHQFSGSKHMKVTATSLFAIRHNHSEPLREYLARFSEATIKVSNPN
ncbi:zeon1 gag protein [Trifolium medium]|uniref:Zeon1 gag protein n=1 Tax=Trifolium medium TaxID=97028 RepID=A0A392MLU6_9FABA|nr:zeon1 gag protein [Trifolium medium]